MKSETEVREKLAELRTRLTKLCEPIQRENCMIGGVLNSERIDMQIRVMNEITILEWMLDEKGTHRPSWEIPVHEGIPL